MAEEVKVNKNPWPLCFYCGHQVVWESDFAGDEYGFEDRENDDGTIEKAEDLIVSNWTCPHCGTHYEILVGSGPFRDND